MTTFFMISSLSVAKMTRKWENCMTIDKESWGYRRNAHAEGYYNMDELTEILAQTIRYAVLQDSDYY